MKENKHKWTKSDKDFLSTWFPHFGGEFVSRELKISLNKVKGMANKYNIRLLPRDKRLCLECRVNYLSLTKKKRGFYCVDCFNIRRKNKRRNSIRPIRERINELLRSARKRSVIKCDLTTDYVISLLEKQNYSCHYSGMKMIFSNWGSGRSPYSVSIDQIIPSKGYTKDNIVLCCWCVNRAKSDMQLEEFINMCKNVVSTTK